MITKGAPIATLLAAFVAFSCIADNRAEGVFPAGLFSRNMVLQCDQPIPVWGKAKPGTSVVVTFAGNKAVAKANAKGDWLAKLPAEKASTEPRTMTVGIEGGKAVEFTDVLVGDVFLYLGGNNAEVRTGKPTSSETFRLIRCKGESMTPATFKCGADKWQKPQDAFGGKDTPDIAFRFAEKWTAKTGHPCGVVVASAYWREWRHYMPPKVFCSLPRTAYLAKPETEYLDYLSTLRSIAQFGERMGGVLPAGDDDSAWACDEPAMISVRYGETYNAMVRPLAHAAFRGGMVISMGKPGFFSEKEWAKVFKLEIDGIRSEFDVQFPILTPPHDKPDVVVEQLVADFQSGKDAEPAQKPQVVADPPAFVPPEFEVSEFITSHMVVQRGKKIPVWGKAKPGKTVVVRFGGAEAKVKADKNGDWCAYLPAMAASFESRTLEVIPPGGAPAVTFEDILVGDVWFASGQSNMEMTFGWGVHGNKKIVAEADSYKWIRTIKVGHKKSLSPVKFRTAGGVWRVCDSKGVGGATAAGYWFARRVGGEIGIPIGLIDTSWSDSPIQPFIPLCGLKTEPYCAKGVESAVANAAAAARIGAIAARRIAAGASVLDAFTFDSPFTPMAGGEWGTRFNAMNEPILRVPVTGMIWFQGCSNTFNGKDYRALQRALVKGWREKHGKDMPIYIAQLSSFTKGNGTPQGGDGFAVVREAQREVAPTIPNFGMAVTIDVGDEGDIHFRNKLDVGDRLALWALRDVYGKKDVEVSGPWFKEMRLEGASARIFFDYVYGGLMAARRDPDEPLAKPVKEEKLSGFSVQDAEGKWHFADAKIDGKTVVVSAPGVSEVRNVRYAYRASTLGVAHPQCRANLYGVNGLPAVPFKTDPW